MGGSFSASLSLAAPHERWNMKGRGPKLRQLFGGYRGQDVWAVQRKFKSMDDGHGFLSFEEVQDLLYFEEPGLLFIWDLFSQQNELMNAKELLTVVCTFSSAPIEEKVRFLLAVFDASNRGLCTGKEIADMGLMVLTVLGKCTGVNTRAKEVTPQISAELARLVPVFAEVVEVYGEKEAFQSERVIGQLEVDRNITPSVRDIYEQLPLVEAVTDTALPPPPGWATAQAKEQVPVKLDDSMHRKEREVKEEENVPIGADPALQHLSWMRRLEDKGTGTTRDAAYPAAVSYIDSAPEPSAAQRWVVMRETDFSVIAMDIPGFKRVYCKSLCSALGLPAHGDCVQVVNATSGSGSIVVECILRPRSHTDSRTGNELAKLLEKQLSSPHSALRKGPLAPYLRDAIILAAAPQAVCDAEFSGVPESPAPTPKKKSRNISTQTNTFELGTPRAGVVKGAAASGSCSALEEESFLAQIRDAIRSLESARQRQTRAKLGEKKAYEEITKRDTLIQQLRDELGG
eukprot:TRINITY_DN109422_c0_g1_i1.p1 TRINITY_DN109422_c0_g1~~TRINITY_DN109422_c0_g1_i1.p1  ORF type:complete len:515 (+),score=112.25 TRINITY_DN109422_c0_g1_i1:83-1627(+)